MLVGKHVKTVEFSEYPGWPTCTSTHVLLPVHMSPPLIKVYTWAGDFLQDLEPGDLELKDDEEATMMSQVCNGRVNVRVNRPSKTPKTTRIVTYKVLLSLDPILWQ